MALLTARCPPPPCIQDALRALMIWLSGVALGPLMVRRQGDRDEETACTECVLGGHKVRRPAQGVYWGFTR